MSQRVSSNLETAELKTLNSITIHPRIYLRHHCNHLTKNVCFLSEIWNLKQIRHLTIANVARFGSLNAVFQSWAKNTTPTYFGKNESLTSEPKHKKLVIDDFAAELLFPSWCYCFLLARNLVGRVNSACLINLLVICTADCTWHHLTEKVYFLCETWNLKQIRYLATANVARFASLNAVFLS